MSTGFNGTSPFERALDASYEFKVCDDFVGPVLVCVVAVSWWRCLWRLLAALHDTTLVAGIVGWTTKKRS